MLFFPSSHSQSRFDPSAGRCVLRHALLLAVLATSGCATFGKRGPTDEKMLAARELCRLGQDAWQGCRWEDARSKFAHALELCPQHVDARRNYARASWQRGERDEALAQMRRVVEQTGGDPAAATELGQMLLEQGEYDEALVCAELALNANSRMTEALVLRGDILRLRGRLTEALDDYHLARSYGCNDPRVLLETAELQLRQHRPDHALATLDRAREISEADAGLQLRHLKLCGVTHKELHRYTDALEYLTRAQQLAAEDPELLAIVGETHLAAGNHRDAQRTLEALVAISPQSARAIALSQQLRMAAQPLVADANELR